MLEIDPDEYECHLCGEIYSIPEISVKIGQEIICTECQRKRNYKESLKLEQRGYADELPDEEFYQGDTPDY